MLKEDLVATIARRNPQLDRSDVETVLTSVIETINEALPRGDRIELTESGSASVIGNRSERRARPRLDERRDVFLAIAATLDEINDKIESIL